MSKFGYRYSNKHNSKRNSIVQIIITIGVVFLFVWTASKYFNNEMKWFFNLPFNNILFYVSNYEIRFPLLFCILLTVISSFIPAGIELKCFNTLPLDFCFPVGKSNLYLLIGTPILFIIAIYIFADFKVIILPILYLSLYSRGK